MGVGQKTVKEDELDERGFLVNMHDLKKRYRSTYWSLRRSLRECGTEGKHPDEPMIREAISDVFYIITWLHTGKRPGNKRGIERRAAYQREKLMDPLLMQSFVSNSKAGSPTNLTDDERFRLEQAMSRLTDRERECYELAHGHGFSFSYIARMLKISKGAVEEYVNRAQKKISDELRNNIFLSPWER